MGKRKKPHPEFPLHAHATGRWAKKIHGKRVYFGKVADDPEGERALELWLEQKDDLLAGRKPRSKAGLVTVAIVCNHYLAFKEAMLNSGEIGQRTYDQYYANCQFIANQFGRTRPVEDLGPDDFLALRAELAKVCGSVRLGNEIQYVRSVFRYGFDVGLLPTPMQFGPGFRKPSAKSMRIERAADGPRMFEAKQIRALLKVAGVNMKAMLLLGINGGMGNTDVASVPMAAFDLKGGWLRYPRPKTGIDRRIPLWPETIAAVRAAIKARPEPLSKEHAGLLLLTDSGRPYVEDGDTAWRISDEFARVAKVAKVKGRQFYDLRRTFQTIADNAHDAVATSAVMGHIASSNDMASRYRQKIEDSRLKAVTAHVRAWLFSAAKTPKQ
jgi:integrase